MAYQAANLRADRVAMVVTTWSHYCSRRLQSSRLARRINDSVAKYSASRGRTRQFGHDRQVCPADAYKVADLSSPTGSGRREATRRRLAPTTAQTAAGSALKYTQVVPKMQEGQPHGRSRLPPGPKRLPGIISEMCFEAPGRLLARSGGALGGSGGAMQEMHGLPAV